MYFMSEVKDKNIHHDSIKFDSVHTETVEDGVVCTVNIPRFQFIKLPDWTDFIELKLSVRAKTEVDALKRIVQLMLKRIEWMCECFEDIKK
jgi:hypothetical protein